MIARSAPLAALLVIAGLSAAAADARLVDAPLPPARPADLAVVTEAPARVVVAPLPPRRPDGLGESVRTFAAIDARR